MSDGQEAQREGNWAVVDDNVTQRRPVHKSPAEFVSPDGEWQNQPYSPISSQQIFSPAGRYATSGVCRDGSYNEGGA